MIKKVFYKIIAISNEYSDLREFTFEEMKKFNLELMEIVSKEGSDGVRYVVDSSVLFAHLTSIQEIATQAHVNPNHAVSQLYRANLEFLGHILNYHEIFYDGNKDSFFNHFQDMVAANGIQDSDK